MIRVSEKTRTNESPEADEIDWTSFDRARMMALGYQPITPEAKAFAKHLAEMFEASPSRRKNKRRGKSWDRYALAAGAFAADLLRADHPSCGRWSFREQAPRAFTGEMVSYRNFCDVHDGFLRAGLVEKGSYYCERWDLGDGVHVAHGKAARFRGLPPLFALAMGFSITPASVDHHFKHGPPRRVLILKQSSERLRGSKAKGKRMKFEKTAASIQLEKEVRELNAFWERHRLDGGTHRGYHRIFNQGDTARYRWNKGGRLYSAGSDNYQLLKAPQRQKMTIDDEPVVEIDIRGSYITILHALKGISFDPSNDPYRVPGLDRKIVKAWVTMTLGHNTFHRRWPDEKTREFYAQGIDLKTRFPLPVVKQKVLDALPVLADWSGQKVTCFDLMYLESQAVIGAMLRLKRGAWEWGAVATLSVHDSIIVPRRASEIAKQVLTETYELFCGATPHLVCSA
jgi:hypothetical protein